MQNLPLNTMHKEFSNLFEALLTSLNLEQSESNLSWTETLTEAFFITQTLFSGA
jgi:hypothetical protein